MAEQLTPMRKQYLNIKKKYSDCLVFVRLGDFYELFDDDAKIASKELDIVLTFRGKNADSSNIPMCGVPYHAYESYLAKLIAKGYKVAICDQLEDPALVKGLVKRGVTRVVSPGTLVDTSMLDEAKSNYISGIFIDENVGGICFCDISTGEVECTSFAGNDVLKHIINECVRFSPREVILSEKAKSNKQLVDVLQNKLNIVIGKYNPFYFDISISKANIEKQFDNADNLIHRGNAVIQAVGAVLAYLYETQKHDLSHLRVANYYSSSKFMELDLNARRNLELNETIRSKDKKGSLLWILDKTKTSMGSRLMRSMIVKPLLNPIDINKRLLAVNELVKNFIVREEIVYNLNNITDLERLIGRIVYGSCNARDLLALSNGLKAVPALKNQLQQCQTSLLVNILGRLNDLNELCDIIDRAFVDEPPLTVREGGMIRQLYNKDVDYLRNIMGNSKDLIADIENKIREECGIKNIRIKYNKVYGYYIEVAKGQVDLVPDNWIRKQTTVNSERFINQELKELEHTILSAQDKITGIEYQLFVEVRDKVSAKVEEIQRTAGAIAELDVLASLAVVAVENNYCMPQVDDGNAIYITDGRHPVVEKMISHNAFIPNDTVMDGTNNTVSIITGPNMAGKSTYMRQVALICLMAQIGSFVPAKQAKIGVVDRIFTRIGASDDLSSGQSTFMVEMDEVAEILTNATSKSLLILDEIGRGTSTYDGMSIAQAVLEYCADKHKLGAKTLFATHYHELTTLENNFNTVKNYNVSAKKTADSIVFLHKIVPGSASRSYGIDVANLAGIPNAVIKRAKNILKELEQNGAKLENNMYKSLDEQGDISDSQEKTSQISGSPDNAENIIEALRSVDINTLTPLEALNLVYQLREYIK